MHKEKYVFSLLTEFMEKDRFRHLANKYYA